MKLIMEPTVEPVTLEEVKQHCRVDHSDEDTLIEAYLKAATRYAESTLCWRAFVEQTLELTLDKFQDEIRLPRPPLQEVVSVKYFDKDNTEQTVDTDVYIVDTDSEPGRVIKADGKSWPTDLRQVNAVKVRYKAGYPMEEVEAEGEAVGTGDDSETVFNLEHYPVVDDSETIYLDGTATTDYTLDDDTGEIAFNAAPGENVAITADYTYEDRRYWIPQEIKQGILLLTAHFYEMREPTVVGQIVTSVPLTVEALLMPHRAWGGDAK